MDPAVLVPAAILEHVCERTAYYAEVWTERVPVLLHQLGLDLTFLDSDGARPLVAARG